MTKNLTLGIDQGSSSTKGVLIDSHIQAVQAFQIPVSLTHNGERWEQDGEELLRSVKGILAQAQRYAGETGAQIEAIGLSLQRSGVIAFEENSGTPLSPLLNWRDTRASKSIEALSPEERALIFQSSGIPPSAHYSGVKYALLQEKYPNDLVGTLDTYLLFHLLDSPSSPFLTEHTMAQRSMLYDVKRRTWCDRLLKIFGVQKERLPSIVPSVQTSYGTIKGIPLHAVIGDAQAALLSLMSEEKAILTLGSVASLSCYTGDSPLQKDGYISSLLQSENHESQQRYSFILEGTVNFCGETVSTIESLYSISPTTLNPICHKASNGVEENNVQIYAPFGPTTTPHWLPNSPAIGKNFLTAAPELKATALVENLGNFLLELLLDFKKFSLLSQDAPILVTGGVSKLDYLLQYLADGSGISLLRTRDPNSSALGAAILAHGINIRERNSVQENQSVQAPGGLFVPRTEKTPSIMAKFQNFLVMREHSVSNTFHSYEKVTLLS